MGVKRFHTVGGLMLAIALMLLSVGLQAQEPKSAPAETPKTPTEKSPVAKPEGEPKEGVAPPDRVFGATSDGLKRLGCLIAPYVKQARESLPGVKKRYAAGLPKAYRLSVVTLFHDSGKYEQAFVRVETWKEKKISGVIANDMELVKNHKRGDQIDLSEDDVLDWVIVSPEGKEEGNFVGKYMDSIMDDPSKADGLCVDEPASDNKKSS